MSMKITIKGKTYDLEDPADLARVQALLVPANWPTNKKDCVRLFQTVSAMLGAQLARHLAFNWKNITKIAQEEGAEGAPARVSIAFAFEIDQSAPSVAALDGIKMSYSAKFSTKGKPQTFDLNQGDFFVSEGLISLDEEKEPAAAPDADGEKKPGAGKKPKKKVDKKPGPTE